MTATKAPYSVYLLLCKGNVIYTGITNDVERRMKEHKDGKGAKFTKTRPPIGLLAHALVGDRSQAQKVEYAVKQLPRAKKIPFLQGLQSTQPLEPSIAK